MTSYEYGFLLKCAESGVSVGDSGVLLKKARETYMSAAPSRNWFQRNISDPVGRGASSIGRWASNAGQNVGDAAYRAYYRMGLGDDEKYAKHVIDDTRRRYNYALEKGRWHPDLVKDQADATSVDRLVGDEYDRGDVYEHAASKEQGPVSTGIVGRALNASQPFPSELSAFGEQGVPYYGTYEALNPNATPGVATALDYGSYAIPYVGNALFARDVAQNVQDGEYGTAAAYAAFPFILKGVGHGINKLPKRARKVVKGVGATGITGLLGAGAVGEVARDVDRNSVWNEEQ